jgi:hypothetical protein
MNTLLGQATEWLSVSHSVARVVRTHADARAPLLRCTEPYHRQPRPSEPKLTTPVAAVLVSRPAYQPHIRR